MPNFAAHASHAFQAGAKLCLSAATGGRPTVPFSGRDRLPEADGGLRGLVGILGQEPCAALRHHDRRRARLAACAANMTGVRVWVRSVAVAG